MKDTERPGGAGEPFIVYVAMSMKHEDWWVHGVFTDQAAAVQAARQGAKLMVGSPKGAMLVECVLNEPEPGGCGMIDPDR